MIAPELCLLKPTDFNMKTDYIFTCPYTTAFANITMTVILFKTSFHWFDLKYPHSCVDHIKLPFRFCAIHMRLKALLTLKGSE